MFSPFLARQTNLLTELNQTEKFPYLIIPVQMFHNQIMDKMKNEICLPILVKILKIGNWKLENPQLKVGGYLPVAVKGR